MEFKSDCFIHELPSSIVINHNEEQSTQSSLAATSPALDNKSSEDQREEADDLFSSSSSSSSQSQWLNPNSSIDNLDLPGIALLKEIFPNESTDALREIHYQNIMLNKRSFSASYLTQQFVSPQSEAGLANITTTNHDCQEESEEKLQLSKNRRTRIELPRQFLRLPRSMAVLRQQERGSKSINDGDALYDRRTYKFIHEMEERALTEYHLANNLHRKDDKQNNIEYYSYVVDKHNRGLGMTLQEVIEEGDQLRYQEGNLTSSHHVVIRYGLKVVGFLPDVSQSPAEYSGIQQHDIVIGINGVAFLLQVPLISSSYTVDRQSLHYKTQKANIIESIQNSPDPVVLHIRRIKLGRGTTTERSSTSLLDADTFDIEDNKLKSMFVQPELSSVDTQQQNSSHYPSIQPQRALSPSAFYKPSPVQNHPYNLLSSSVVLHPLSTMMAQRNLIRSGEDQWRITRRLQQFTERSRQWESSNSLRIVIFNERSSVGILNSGSLAPYFDPNDLPPDMANLMVFRQDKKTFANQRIETQQQRESATYTNGISDNDNMISRTNYGDEDEEKIRSSANYQSSESTARRLFRAGQQLDLTNSGSMAWIPLYGVRKSLNARIVNSFIENGLSKDCNSTKSNMSFIAYTIFVYDVESGREWYAPIRYWKDFSELYKTAMSLLPPSSNMHKELSKFHFPKEPLIPNNSNDSWGVSMFGNRRSNSLAASSLSPVQQRRKQKKNEEFEKNLHQTCKLLEEFLRELLGIVYTCEPLHPNIAEIALYVQSFIGVEAGLEGGTIYFSDPSKVQTSSERVEITKMQLKRSIQYYSWRIFLLHTMKAVITDFVELTRDRGPKKQEVESMEVRNRISLKARAMDELKQIRKFVDQLVDLILDGCNDDFRSIAKRREFSSIRYYLTDESNWDRIVRDSVREQVEIEVYIPLRSMVSRLLVSGWRHDDMGVHFKIKVNKSDNEYCVSKF